MEENIYGPCCACGGGENVRNIIMLNVKGVEPGCGWGCVVCGLPCDGALAILCDDCVDRNEQPLFAALGYVIEKKRIPIGELTVPHKHDLSMHYLSGHSNMHNARLN